MHLPRSSEHNDLVRVDLFGTVVALERRLVVELRNRSADRAGVSSRYPDLSLVLDRSLSTGTLTLRRHELRLLIRLAAAGTSELQSLAGELERAGRNASAQRNPTT